MHTISEKAIRFRHLDYNPDRAQKLISSSMSRPLSTRNILSKSVNAFMSNVANRQTERQTNEQTDRHGQNIYQKHLTSSSGVNDVEGRSRSLAIPIRHNSVVCIVTTVYRVSFLRHFYRATHMHRADYAVARCLPVRLSVCLSVRPSHAGIVCKRLHISSKFFRHRVAPQF